jgi:peptidoglycan/xylan/chitin deacetylase (PgdA/CDA1 family)
MGIEEEPKQAPRGGGKRQQLARSCHRAGLLPLLQRVRAARGAEVRVLAYHRVLDIGDGSRFEFDQALVSATPERFRQQMELVRRRFRAVSSTKLIAALEGGRPLPRDAVIVTFDDGYDDNYRFAFPILRELGVPATFFVSTGHIDSGLPYAYDWLVHMVCVATAPKLDVPEVDLQVALPVTLAQRQALAADLLDRMKWLDDTAQNAIITRLERDWSMPRTPHADCRPMSWEQLREMQAAGMDIGSHGVNHRMLARLPTAVMADEVRGSKQALDRELGVAGRTLSYPVGGPNAYSEDVIASVRDNDFRVAFNYISGSNPLPVTDRFAMRRLPVEYDTDIGWFAGIVTWPELFSHPTRLRIG